MYNGIGLSTVRGSGTNGHVQRNFAILRKRDKIDFKEDSKNNQPNRQPNQDILNHARKRKMELKCIEYTDALEGQGYTPEEIIAKVESYRAILQLNDTGEDFSKKDKEVVQETHHIALANQQKNLLLREAFGISQYFTDGSSLDSERREREAQLQAASQKSYTLVPWDKSPEEGVNREGTHEEVKDAILWRKGYSGKSKRKKHKSASKKRKSEKKKSKRSERQRRMKESDISSSEASSSSEDFDDIDSSDGRKTKKLTKRKNKSVISAKKHKKSEKKDSTSDRKRKKSDKKKELKNRRKERKQKVSEDSSSSSDSDDEQSFTKSKANATSSVNKKKKDDAEPIKDLESKGMEKMYEDQHRADASSASMCDSTKEAGTGSRKDSWILDKSDGGSGVVRLCKRVDSVTDFNSQFENEGCVLPKTRGCLEQTQQCRSKRSRSSSSENDSRAKSREKSRSFGSEKVHRPRFDEKEPPKCHGDLERVPRKQGRGRGSRADLFGDEHTLRLQSGRRKKKREVSSSDVSSDEEPEAAGGAFDIKPLKKAMKHSKKHGKRGAYDK